MLILPKRLMLGPRLSVDSALLATATLPLSRLDIGFSTRRASGDSVHRTQGMGLNNTSGVDAGGCLKLSPPRDTPGSSHDASLEAT